ncbi:hypothetical protein J437_LFUL008944 [Ladona fulva]|uniref:Uncharacterized protein n=1 Tax=Ladona fulva TaxID=123851 RepID=A0A8K0P499_LADFU|nr:hypothetical protein J437_LFUL008944 [Ladona fulva]
MLLSKMFQAPINVEYYNSVKSIKCVCTYVNNGSDMAVFAINDPFARTLLYADIPSYYTWNATRRIFQRRKRGTPVEGNEGIFKSDECTKYIQEMLSS